MIHKINLLKSIEQQDVLSCSYAFKEISRVCNWSAEAQQNVFRHVVNIDIQYNIGAPTDPTLYVSLLLKRKYNKEISYKYYARLASQKKRNFTQSVSTCMKSK